MNTFAPHHEIVSKIEKSRWYRGIEACFLSLPLFVVLGLLMIGAVHGNPIYDALSRLGATRLLPVVGYFDRLFAPLNGMAITLQTKIPFLASLPQSRGTQIYEASLSLYVLALLMTFATAIVRHYKNDRSARALISW